MKKLVLILVSFLTFSSYSQSNFDTVYVNCVDLYGDDKTSFIISTTDGKQYHTNVKSSVGDIFGYYDNTSKYLIPKWEFENSLFNQLYFSEYLWDDTCKPVTVVSKTKSTNSEFKYEIVTDINITYYTNYPPNVGDVVFHINSKGDLVNVVKPYRKR